MATTFSCPNCGAEVPITALACPQCGSDENTGWSDEANYAHLLTPEYDDTAVRRQPAWRRVLLIVLALGMAGTAVAALYRVNPAAALGGLLLLVISGILLYRGLPVAGRNGSSKLYDDLLRKARGDAALVERWISYEASRHPDGDEQTWMENARDRWERDNR